MLETKVEEWIGTLRKGNREAVRDFLNVSLDFFDDYRDFLKGSGYYVIGSALSRRNFLEKGDFLKREEKMWDESMKRVVEKFGNDKLDTYMRLATFKTLPEKEAIDEMLREEQRKVWEEVSKRDNYNDIDLVITGLTRKKSNPRLRIWREFSKNLRIKFPNALHPKRSRDNGFGNWEIYPISGPATYIVSDYLLTMSKIKIPTPNEATKIHFMIYYSDERFGMKFHSKTPTDHSPSKDVSLDMWKKRQEKDGFPYLTVREF